MSQQHLIWRSVELEDDYCLHDYKLVDFILKMEFENFFYRTLFVTLLLLLADNLLNLGCC